MKKKFIAILLTAMLGAEPCSMVYAEEIFADKSVENDNTAEVKVTEETETEQPEAEQEETTEENESDVQANETDASDADEIEMQESETAPEELSEELSEDDAFSAGDSEAEIEEVSIVSEPNKKEYDYGTVKSASDFDLTGLVIRISYSDGKEETLSFTRDKEEKSDSRGNTFYPLIYFDEEDGGNDGDLGEYDFVIVSEEEGEVASSELSIVLSAATPHLENKGKGVYSRTVGAETYTKFIPEADGEYIVRRTFTEDSQKSTLKEEIYDSEFNRIDVVNYDTGSVKLKKGNVYYIKPFRLKNTVTAEYVWPIKSVALQGKFKTAVFYTPVNFWSSGKNKYTLEKAPWHGQKLKITYTNGETESVDIYKSNHYGQYINAYINYSGNKKSPEAGTYDVHFRLGESGAEAVLKKGIQVKNLSQMPAIVGKGTKVMPVTGSIVYSCLKTTSAGKYTIKCKDWDSYSYLTVSQLKNGELKQILSVENGKSCTLKANSVYYIGLNIHSGVMSLDNMTFSVSQGTDKTQISKTKITVGTLSYTGTNVKPAVTVKNGKKTLRQGADYTISYNKASKIGTAVKVTITGKGSYTGKIAKTVYIVPARSTVSSAIGGKKRLTVSFKKATGASGYQIAYSTSQNRGYKYTYLNSKIFRKTITGLSSGKKYYVKVRAYKTVNGKKYYGNYSAVKSVKVK